MEFSKNKLFMKDHFPVQTPLIKRILVLELWIITEN